MKYEDLRELLKRMEFNKTEPEVDKINENEVVRYAVSIDETFQLAVGIGAK